MVLSVDRRALPRAPLRPKHPPSGRLVSWTGIWSVEAQATTYVAPEFELEVDAARNLVL